MTFSPDPQVRVDNTKRSALTPSKSPQVERDDKLRHAREFSFWLLSYAKQIEAVRARNKRLEEELSFDAHAERDDPFYNDQMAGKLGELYLQESNTMVRLEFAKQELSHLDQETDKYEALLANQKEKSYAISNYNQTHLIISGKIRKIEHDLDRRVLKLNEKLRSNRQLHDTLDTLYNERVRMDAVYTKTGLEMLQKQHQINELEKNVQSIQSQVSDIESNIQHIRHNGELYEQECTQRANHLLMELTNIGMHQHPQSSLGSLLPKDLLTLFKKFDIQHDTIDIKTQTFSKTLLKSVNKNRWKCGRAKANTNIALSTLTKNLRLIQQIHQLHGTTSVAEIIQIFHAQEAEQFARMQQVNCLAQEVEERRQIVSSLRERIARVKSHNYAVDSQRAKQVEAVKTKLQRTLEQTRVKKQRVKAVTTFLDVLQPKVLSIHTQIGCESQAKDGNSDQLFSDIEERATTILEHFHAREIACDDTNHNMHNQLELAISPKESNFNYAKPPKDSLSHQSGSKYRYKDVELPQLSMEDLNKRDGVDEVYAYTYEELKSEPWAVMLCETMEADEGTERQGTHPFDEYYTLESPWITCFTESGILYYYNTETAASQWERPGTLSPNNIERASTSESDDDPLPYSFQNADDSLAPLQRILRQMGRRIHAFQPVTTHEFEALFFAVKQLHAHRSELEQSEIRARREVERLHFVINAANRRCDLLEVLAKLAQNKLHDEKVAHARYCSGLERQLEASIDANKQLFHKVDTCKSPESMTVPSERVGAVCNEFYQNAKEHPISLSDAIKESDIVTLQQVLAEKGVLTSDDRFALHLACQYGQLHVMALLIEYAADIEGRDERGNTPLLIACQFGHSDCVRFLVQSAANLHVRNYSGQSAMELAIQSGDDECVRILEEVFG
uniref:Uncharacterized protein AlNc14C1G117 n=1 Tax=Albugo laibachii Nc14 TaxID=890382 RepID=F0VYW6_9STRA|nr:conserved hypothetical protein [Albugo laibachii Nc14]|eukprot:CCA13981.1 conserved hypothetical protein [Albugo laibachii Nc14]